MKSSSAVDRFMRNRLIMVKRDKRGKLGRVNTSLLSNPAHLIVALCVCSHTKSDNFCFEYTHYTPVCRSGSHSSPHDYPRLLSLPSQVPPLLRGTPSHGRSEGGRPREEAPGSCHTHCRQSTFTCDGKTCGRWTVYSTHEQRPLPNLYRSERGWENNEPGFIWRPSQSEPGWSFPGWTNEKAALCWSPLTVQNMAKYDKHSIFFPL